VRALLAAAAAALLAVAAPAGAATFTGQQRAVLYGIARNDGALRRHFAVDPESWAAREYLSIERMSIG
jgi:hypothetical protein